MESGVLIFGVPLTWLPPYLLLAPSQILMAAASPALESLFTNPCIVASVLGRQSNRGLYPWVCAGCVVRRPQVSFSVGANLGRSVFELCSLCPKQYEKWEGGDSPSQGVGHHSSQAAEESPWVGGLF